MRTITIPNNIKINTKVNDEIKVIDFSFADYMINNPLANNAFGTNLDMLEKCQEIIEELQEQDRYVGQTEVSISIDDDVWEIINKLVNYPTQAYEPKLALQLLPFFRAIRDAKEYKRIAVKADCSCDDDVFPQYTEPK